MRQRPPLGLTDDKHEERAALAKCIIALARNGERDPAVLRDGVLRELAVSAWRGMGTTSVEPTTAAKPPSNSRALHHYELGPVGVFNLIRPAHALAIDTAQGEPKGRGRAVCGREPVRDRGKQNMSAIEQMIRERAYELWDRADRPEGRSDEFWFAARAEFESEEGTGHGNLSAHPPALEPHPREPAADRAKNGA